MCNDYAPFKIRAIRVREASQTFLAYVEEEETLYPLEEKSNDKPAPGDYAAFCRVHARGWSRLLRALHPEPTFAAVLNSDPDTADLNIMPLAIEDYVRGKCDFCNLTGSGESKDGLGVVWIFPPGETSLPQLEGRLPQDLDMDAFVTSDNAILRSNDLIEPFYQNVYGVDVDDGYRIVQFVDYPDPRLPSHVPDSQIPRFNARTQIFLRQHFRWCLRVHLCGGHVLDDFSRGDILSTMNELGMGFDDEVEEPPLDDPRWQTEIGKICFRMRLHSRIRMTG
ncbi:hypothetical protein SISSUDRAFT_1031598 [Sistotremastrum suecicum HHB10207 ss-3]|uniref:Uncharacterized protein n=1 Tax=Sistotremastrum suecicum HHB10207 ss-3 TaxID=1314776 RepID=A0A166FP01_9AGAM|nr:hypothetical protein SISSUDRAFT_1031598 [Sistotremastrum suecicum HHB10207 ss-3]